VITAGVDLAADRSRTAAALVDWAGGRAVVTEIAVHVDDDAIVQLAAGADKVGIDCPLGWPDSFVDFVVRHRDGAVDEAADTVAARRQLVYRATDLRCQERGLRPLSVAADRIAHAALRCAGLLARLGESDRSGEGRVVEAYPAGSLKIWQLRYQRYKDVPDHIAASVAEIERRLGLEFSRPSREICLGSDHAFDAVIVALTARAAALGRTEPPRPDLRATARREGWISLPDPALETLRDHEGVPDKCAGTR
jgi:predicted nuclease with RNAse H fold